MRGLRFTDSQDFTSRFLPLLPELRKLWWLVDFQDGPFDSLWIFASEENERRFEQAHFPVPICENTSSQVWRPGTLPDLAPVMRIFQEWARLVGFEAREDEVQEIVNRIQGSSTDYSTVLENLAQIYIHSIDEDWLEVYSPRLDWLDSLQLAWPAAQSIDSMQAEL